MRIDPLLAVVTLSAAMAQQLPPTITNAPYSADQVQERGIPATSSNVIGHFYRDSQGRTRTESALKSSPAWRVEIWDPVTGFAYVVEDENKIARRTRAPLTPRPNAPPQATIVKLGAQTIEGVPVEGTRRTFPSPGGIPGLTIETWEATELRVTMLTKSSNGYTSRLINLRREEPDAALFRPPADYTIVDR